MNMQLALVLLLFLAPIPLIIASLICICVFFLGINPNYLLLIRFLSCFSLFRISFSSILIMTELIYIGLRSFISRYSPSFFFSNINLLVLYLSIQPKLIMLHSSLRSCYQNVSLFSYVSFMNPGCIRSQLIAFLVFRFFMT